MSPVVRAGIGAVACIAFGLARVSGPADAAWSHALLLFAALVLVPLALELLRDETEPDLTARWFLWIERLQFPAALLLLVACWLAPGTVPAILALPWFALTAIMAIIGVTRIRRGGLRRDLDALCRDVALIFAVVGGAWTLADRAGLRPLNFDPAIVTLTAVHFHYAGLLLPLFAGLVQRELFFFRLASRAAVGVVLGVPAVALGITATQIGAGRSFEAAAGCGLALAGMAVGILHVRYASDSRQPIATRVLLAVAGVSLFIAMVLATAYAVRAFTTPFPGLGIPQMRLIHGTINAVGFGLCGVLGWRSLQRRPS
jgi:hypothetical protein